MRRKNKIGSRKTERLGHSHVIQRVIKAMTSKSTVNGKRHRMAALQNHEPLPVQRREETGELDFVLLSCPSIHPPRAKSQSEEGHVSERS
jgi:hypothetical protein